MKKRIWLMVFLIMLVLINLDSSLAQQNCAILGGHFCGVNELCYGEEKDAYDNVGMLKKCCVGKCVPQEDISCENATSIGGVFSCQLKTSGEFFTNLKFKSNNYFFKLLNPPIPAKPYPKMWDLWFNIAIYALAIVFVLNIMGFMKTMARETSTPADIDRFKRYFFLAFINIFILLALPELVYFFMSVINIFFTGIVRLFIPNGDVLSTIYWLVSGQANNIAYLFRDLSYYAFLLILFLRYATIYVLLIFLPLIIVLYNLYLTEELSSRFCNLLFYNLTVPIWWAVLFTVLAYTLRTSIPSTNVYTIPLAITGIFCFAIWFYRKYVKIRLSFIDIGEKAISIVRTFL